MFPMPGEASLATNFGFYGHGESRATAGLGLAVSHKLQAASVLESCRDVPDAGRRVPRVTRATAAGGERLRSEVIEL